MSLLGKEKALIENDYFQVWEIVEMLREYSNGSWEDVVEFLGHYNFDTELTLYCRDGFHRMHEVRNNHGPIRNLIHDSGSNEEAEKAVTPGIPLSSLDQIARGIITDKGYGSAFTHRLGHFIGLEDHEFGDVSSASADKAVPGNIFSIEPGVYLENDMGVRVEDLVLVTDHGHEILNHFSKELTVID